MNRIERAIAKGAKLPPQPKLVAVHYNDLSKIEKIDFFVKRTSKEIGLSDSTSYAVLMAMGEILTGEKKK